MSVNKVILVGYVGQDPVMHFQPQGEAIANISLATTERWKAKDGAQQEKTEWHKIVLFGRLAEVTQKYVKKGGQVYIEGKLQTRKYQDKAGRDVYTTEIVANALHMLGRKDAKQDQPVSAPVPNTVPTNAAEFEDDLPF